MSEVQTARTRPTREQETKARRRRRESLGEDRNLKLFFPEAAKDPNFVYRVINDVPGRIEAKTVHDDWDIVTDAMLADPSKDSSEGTPIKRFVGADKAGQPIYGFLCRKPKEFYEEDKAEQQKQIAADEENLRRGEAKGAEALTGPHAYVPGGRNTIRKGN
jgi:hypothetical protein